MTASYIVHSELYHDIRKGEIELTLHGGFGAAPQLLIDVVATGDTTSRIDVIDKPGRASSLSLFRAFLIDGKPVCAK